MKTVLRDGLYHAVPWVCRWDQWANDAMVDLFELEDTLQMLEGRPGACEKVEPRLDPVLGSISAASTLR